MAAADVKWITLPEFRSSRRFPPGAREQREFNGVVRRLRRQHGKGMGLPSLGTDPGDRGEPRLETIREGEAGTELSRFCGTSH